MRLLWCEAETATMTIQMIHGDCRDFLPIDADVCITDPPYAIDKWGNMIGQLSPNYHEKGTHTRGYIDHDKTQYGNLMLPALDGINKSLPKGGLMVMFGAGRTYHHLAEFVEKSGFEIVDLLVFVKKSTFARAFSTLAPMHELAIFARKPGPKTIINPQKNIGNVFNIDRPRSSEGAHPTVKAQSWMTRVVEVFSLEGETVLDPFAGSGSTLLACKTMGNPAIGIEKVETYYNEAIKRLSDE